MNRTQLRLVGSRNAEKVPAKKEALPSFTTIDLFCGAGGITEGFHQAGYRCLYGNDCMPEAIKTFSLNHSKAWSDGRDIEEVEPAKVRKTLGLRKGALDVLVGGPPCQGFSINAPERFLSDRRNKLFRDYVRFIEEFEPKTFLFENVPGFSRWTSQLICPKGNTANIRGF